MPLISHSLPLKVFCFHYCFIFLKWFDLNYEKHSYNTMDLCTGIITFSCLFSFPFLVFPSIFFFNLFVCCLAHWQTLSPYLLFHRAMPFLIYSRKYSLPRISKTQTSLWGRSLFSHHNSQVSVTSAVHTWLHSAVASL